MLLRKFGYFWSVCGLFLAACIFAGTAFAQTTTGAVTGEVMDPTNAAVVNATVVAENLDTGVKTTTTTNGDGIYTLRFLPIGKYRVRATAPGFAASVTTPFSLEINQTVKLNTVLSISSSSQSVEVETTAPILDTTDGTVSTTFSNQEIQTFPLEGRNFQSVTLYTPGVVQTDPSNMTGANATERSTTNSNLISVNGNRGQANYYTLDGVDINEPQNNQISYNPAPDSLQEIKVISGNAPAIYGNANGGEVVAVLKSGTNQFHGSAYVYLQNNKLNANSWENKYSSLPINRYTQTIFGGTFGGPVRIPHLYDGRDKLFFFVDYEGTRLPSAKAKSYKVLTPAMLNGDFSAIPFQLYNTQGYVPATQTTPGYFPIFAGNKIPVNNPIVKYINAHPGLYPAPTPGVALPPNTYIPLYNGVERSYTKDDQFDAKIDWTPGTKDHVSGFYAQSRARDGSNTIFPLAFPANNTYPTTLFGASWVHDFSTAIVNQFNLGFTRTNWNSGVPIDYTGQFGYSGDAVVGIPFGQQRYVGFTQAKIEGTTNIGTPAAPQLLIDNTFQYNDNLTIQHGHHLFTLGVQAVRYQENYTQSQNYGALGFFNYTGIFTANPNASNPQIGAADFVLDAASQGNGQSDALGLQDGGEFGNRQWRIAGYFQDDWKVTPALTLNLGIRYEYDQPMTEANNKNANVLPINGGILEYAVSVPVGAPAGSIVCPTSACYKGTYDQVMPRFGFAYQLNPKFTIRGGYGATSFLEGNAANQRLTNNPPLVSTLGQTAQLPSSTSGGTARHMSNGFTNLGFEGGGSYSMWPQNQQPAYIQQYNLTVEEALNNVTSLAVAYVGQTGQHLIDYGNVNQFTQAQAYDVNVNNPNPLPARDLTPYYKLAGAGGGVLITESRAMSNYNGLQVTLRQLQKHGLEYNLNYTFAKSMTNAAGNYGVPATATTSGDQTFQDYFNSAADYGVSGDDIRHQFNALIVYALPYGRGRQFGGNANIVLDEILGGWSLTNGFKAFTGPPVTIVANGGNTGSYGGERANQYGHIHIVGRNLNNWFGTDPTAQPCLNTGAAFTPIIDPGSKCAYGQPALYQFGTAANGTERAPGYYQLDTSLLKDFRIYRSNAVGFRADFFNILNVADYSNPDNNIQDSNFGQINNVRNQERRIQLSLNYKF